MADPTIFEYSLMDDQGLTNRNSIYVAYNGATATINSLIGAWSAFGGLLDAVVDGQITGGRITVPLIPDVSWKAAPTEGNNVNQVMALNFQNDFNSYLTQILLPSYMEAILTPAGTPDLDNVDLAAYIAAIIAGSGAIFPNSRDIHDLNAIQDAFLTVRKVKNQRTRTRVIPG
jgi:hypothetical protein